MLKSFEGADGMKTGFTNAAGYNIVTSAERNGHRVIAVTMGHNTIRQRDTKVASLMKKGLQKLAMSDHIEAPNLYANADTHTYGEPSLIEAATVAGEAPASDVWAVQIGAFSNYVKARNYAISVKNSLKWPARK